MCEATRSDSRSALRPLPRRWASSANTKLLAVRKAASILVVVAVVQAAGGAAPTEDGLNGNVPAPPVAPVRTAAQQREEQERQIRRMIWAQCLAGSADTPIKLPQELIDLVRRDSAKGVMGTRLVQLAHEDEVAAAAGDPRVPVRLCCRG